MSVEGVEILGPVPDDLAFVLSPEALAFIAGLAPAVRPPADRAAGPAPEPRGRAGGGRLRRAAQSRSGCARRETGKWPRPRRH